MKRIILGLLMIVSVASLKAQQINDENVEKREVASFHGVKVQQGIKVYLSQGNESSVAVSADEIKFRDQIRTVVENGVLRIYFDNEENWKVWKQFGNKHLRAYVSVSKLDLLKVSSGANVEFTEEVNAGSLEMEITSGATVNGKIKATSISVDMNSGATATLTGTVSGEIKVESSSGAIFRGYDLKAVNGDFKVSSGAGVQTYVSKELSASASSGGYIHIKGEGLIRDIKTSSGGAVTRKS